MSSTRGAIGFKAWLVKHGIARDQQQRLMAIHESGSDFRIKNQIVEDVSEKFGVHSVADAIMNDPNDSSMYAENYEGLLHIFQNDSYPPTRSSPIILIASSHWLSIHQAIFGSGTEKAKFFVKKQKWAFVKSTNNWK